jgi:hypothetical protein
MLLWVCGIAWTLSAQPEPLRAVPFRQAAPPPTPKPTPKVFVALPNYDEETATRLQIFLDNNNFGPGKIDGKMGEFFRKALISFKHGHAQRETGVVDQSMLDQVPQTFTTYTIKADDLAYVGNLPTAHEEQAKLKFLPYTSLLEFVAERYHSAETYIQKLNPGMDWEHLEPGDELRVPNVLPCAKFMSIPKSGCLKSSTMINLFAFFRSRPARPYCRRRLEPGKFKARRRGPGFAMTRACLTMASGRKTITTCPPARII